MRQEKYRFRLPELFHLKIVQNGDTSWVSILLKVIVVTRKKVAGKNQVGWNLETKFTICLKVDDNR